MFQKKPKLWALAGYSWWWIGDKGPSNGCEAPSACDESGFVVMQLKNDSERNTHKLFFTCFFAYQILWNNWQVEKYRPFQHWSQIFE